MGLHNYLTFGYNCQIQCLPKNYRAFIFKFHCPNRKDFHVSATFSAILLWENASHKSLTNVKSPLHNVSPTSNILSEPLLQLPWFAFICMSKINTYTQTVEIQNYCRKQMATFQFVKVFCT